MFRRAIRHLLTFSVLAAFVGPGACTVRLVSGSPVPAAFRDQVGSWHGSAGPRRLWLRIKPDGDVSYVEREPGYSETMNMGGRAWSPTSFTIGAWPLQHVAHIDAAPHLVQGAWHMTVDGIDLQRS